MLGDVQLKIERYIALLSATIAPVTTNSQKEYLKFEFATGCAVVLERSSCVDATVEVDW